MTVCDSTSVSNLNVIYHKYICNFRPQSNDTSLFCFIWQSSSALLFSFTGSLGWAEGSWGVLCSESSEERCSADGWRCGVHNGGEKSLGFSLGKSFSYAPLLHLPDQGIPTSSSLSLSRLYILFRSETSICCVKLSTGTSFLRDGVFKRRRLDVSYPGKGALWTLQSHVSHSCHADVILLDFIKKHTPLFIIIAASLTSCLWWDSDTESMSWWKADTLKAEPLFTFSVSLPHSLSHYGFFLLHNILKSYIQRGPLADAH